MATETSSFFDVTDRGAVTIVHVLEPTIRHPGQAEQFGADLNALVDRDGRNRLVVDFHRNHYLGSTAFAVLIGLAKKVEAARGKLALCSLDPDVLVGANIIGLGKIIPIFEGEADAIEAVSS